MTTRGEGLADLLFMKREFERHITRFTKLTRRVEEIEKGNSFIRNLDLEAMVTPGVLEEKVRMEFKFLEDRLETMRTQLTNNLEQRCLDVTDKLTVLIQERVSKQVYLQNKTFMNESIREAKEIAKRAEKETSSLQTKYNSLDEFYVKRCEFEEMLNKQKELNDKIDEKIKRLDYDSEDDSQANESIDEISHGDIKDNDDDAKSRASLQNLRSNPELLSGQDTDVKSLMSGGKKGGKTTAAAMSNKYSIQEKSGF